MELMHWSKVMDRKAYNALCKVYTTNIGKLYERDIKDFLDDAKQMVSGLSGVVYCLFFCFNRIVF